jgi:thioredoxin reductase (NADPH)
MDRKARPVLLAVDDERQVLRAVESDLRRRFGEDYRVVSASSGEVAVDALRRLKLRNESVALLLVDQRMPGMSGIDLLRQAIEYYPDSKRVLLTAYADTEAAIRAINEVGVDHYLLKPWEPPEERLYPVLDDLLADWLAAHRPAFEGIRLIGPRWSPRAHEIRDFLGRNQVPYQWLNVETDPDARRLLAALGTEEPPLPVLLFPDGSHLDAPTNIDLARKIGLHTSAGHQHYDLVIVGAGPAGLAGAVYAASEGLGTLVVERQAPGGQAGTSSRIENYLGFPSGIPGSELMRRAVTQAVRFGAELLIPGEVTGLRAEGPFRYVRLASGEEISADCILVATGVAYRLLEVDGLARFVGAGVYYGAALSEARLMAGEEICVVGGANSAGQAALYFSRFARRVRLIVRASSLSVAMSHYLIGQIMATENIDVLCHTQVVEAHGGIALEAVTIIDTLTGTRETVPARALCVFIGATPRTDWLAELLARDEQGYVLTGPDIGPEGRAPGRPLEREPYLLEASVPGIFVAGDVRANSVKRVASAAGEGAMSVQFIHQYRRER